MDEVNAVLGSGILLGLGMVLVGAVSHTDGVMTAGIIIALVSGALAFLMNMSS